jgi:soluble lytic murein transglycosylase-like protein
MRIPAVLLLFLATPVTLSAQASRAALHERIRTVALAEGISPDVALALISIESAFDTAAVNRTGNVGLMQLFPSTARTVIPGTTRDDLFNPEINVRIGLRYLRELMDRYGGDLEKGLRAYKNGPNAVDRGGGYSDASNSYIRRFHAARRRFAPVPLGTPVPGFDRAGGG